MSQWIKGRKIRTPGKNTRTNPFLYLAILAVGWNANKSVYRILIEPRKSHAKNKQTEKQFDSAISFGS